MHDRLAELKAKKEATAQPLLVAQRYTEVHVTIDPHHANSFMAEFFEHVEKLKADIDVIRKNVSTIRLLHKKAMNATTAEEEKSVCTQLEKVLEKLNTHNVELKNKLDELREENAAFTEANPGSSEAKIRVNVCNVIMRKFRDALMSYQLAQSEYKAGVEEKVKRQIKLVYPEASDEDLEQMMEQGTSAAIHNRIGRGRVSLHNAVIDINDQYRDLRKLEQSVQELLTMFKELGALVDAQGDIVDQIEYSVAHAREYVERGEENLAEATQIQRRHIKFQLFVYLVLCLMALYLVSKYIVPLFRSNNHHKL